LPLFAVVCRDGVGPPAKWATEPIPRKHRRNERSSARFSFAVVCLSMSARGGRWVHLSTKRDQVALVPHAHGRSGGRRSIQLSYWRGDNLHPPPPSSTTSYQIGASGFEPATSWSRSGTKSPRVATQYSNHAVFWASVSRHGSAKQPGIARNSRRGFVNQTPPRPPECTWGKNHRGRPDESPLLGRFVLATRSVPARVPLGADERAVAKVFGHSGWMNGDAGSTAEYWMSSTVLPPGGFNPASSRTRFALSWSVHAVSPLRPRPPTMCPREL